MKVLATQDISYPNKEGKTVVLYKKGDVINDKSHIEMFLERSKEFVEVVEGKHEVVTSAEKPSKARKKK